jgi:hypothetical protein
METDDSYQYVASAHDSAGGSVMAIASATTAGPMRFTFPAPWQYSGPTRAALPTFDFSYKGFAGASGVNEAAMLQWNVGTSGEENYAENTLTLLRTENYGQHSTRMTVPDLSSLTGFLAPPASGTQVSWRAYIEQASFDILAPQPPSSMGSLVQTSGTYTVPWNRPRTPVLAKVE